MRSARLTAVARTAIRTSAGPSGDGGTSPSRRTVSSPGSRITMARMASPHHTIGPLVATGARGCIIAHMWTGFAVAVLAVVGVVLWWLRAHVRELDDRMGD